MQEKGSVQSIDRALSVLEALTGEREGISLAHIAQRVDLHKSTTHRLLATLCNRGYAERLPGGDYRLGRRVVELASMYLNQLELKTEAQPHLRRLLQQTTQPVHLAVLEGLEAIYIDKMETLHSIRMYSQIGLRTPAYCTGVGKALLSGLTDEELSERFTGIPLEYHTPNTITDPAVLMRDIRRTRKRGWACDNEENETGIRCIAAPVFDYRGDVVAAVSTSGVARVIEPSRDIEIAKYVKQCAEAISARMGYSKGKT
jgi:DNA-binding IclR family transcriptional regulator